MIANETTHYTRPNNTDKLITIGGHRACSYIVWLSYIADKLLMLTQTRKRKRAPMFSETYKFVRKFLGIEHAELNNILKHFVSK